LSQYLALHSKQFFFIVITLAFITLTEERHNATIMYGRQLFMPGLLPHGASMAGCAGKVPFKNIYSCIHGDMYAVESGFGDNWHAHGCFSVNLCAGNVLRLAWQSFVGVVDINKR
jgi:hypothetical protein